jgi:hypothetical protein
MAAAVEVLKQQALDDALLGRFAATSLALAVLGLGAELEGYAFSQEEIARRVGAVGFLAADVLEFTAKLEAALEGEA